MRYDRWKFNFQIQDHHGFEVWDHPFTKLRVPLIIDIRADPFERAWIDSEDYRHWQMEHAFVLVPAQANAMKFLLTFKEFPQRQKVGSFNLDNAIGDMSKQQD
jgi:arylsulfatase